jgi:hypothetical protein
MKLWDRIVKAFKKPQAVLVEVPKDEEVVVMPQAIEHVEKVMTWEPYEPKWKKPVPTTGVDSIIVWHVRPDTNWKALGHHSHLRIRPWDKTKPFPDRDVAYAYQTGKGFWSRPYLGPKEWSIELESLSPMVYFGEPVQQDDGLYCRDDHGELHGPLEEGDTIEPIVKGEITITHNKPPKKYATDHQGDWDE